MIQYNTLNVKLSNFQINKLKFGMKNGTEVALKPSSNVVTDCNDENNCPHKLLLINTQVSKLRKGRNLEPLLKTGLSSMKNVLKNIN